jgi:hypothetical protein
VARGKLRGVLAIVDADAGKGSWKGKGKVVGAYIGGEVRVTVVGVSSSNGVSSLYIISMLSIYDSLFTPSSHPSPTASSLDPQLPILLLERIKLAKGEHG